MLLIEKAWAKIQRSYNNLLKKSEGEFFSEMTGVPLPDLYNSGDFLISRKYDFEPN
jgi:hypothetical protein